MVPVPDTGRVMVRFMVRVRVRVRIRVRVRVRGSGLTLVPTRRFSGLMSRWMTCF